MVISELFTSPDGSSGKTTSNCPTPPTHTLNELLVMSIISYLMSSPVKLNSHLEVLVSRLHTLYGSYKLSFDMKSSIVMLSTLILTTNNQYLVNSFTKQVGLHFPNLDSEMASFSRLLGRLKAIESSPRVGYQYFHDHCLKQPHDMSRWLNLLEFGLEYLEDLKDVANISKIFFFTNRPWCFTTFEVQVNSSIELLLILRPIGF